MICCLSHSLTATRWAKSAFFAREGHELLIFAGSSAALFAGLSKSYDHGEPFVTYLWEPHWFPAKYDMVELDEPVYNATNWSNLSKQNPKRPILGTRYPDVDVYVASTTQFAKSAPKLANFLSKMKITTIEMNKNLAYTQETKMSYQDFAVHFLKTRSDIWKGWVDEQVFMRVNKAIAAKR